MRSIYILRLLEYSAGEKVDDEKAMLKIKKFFRVIHKRQRFGYKMSYGIGALLRQPAYKVTNKETKKDPGEFKFWIPIRQNCVAGNDPISIASNAQFKMFHDSLDYTRIKDKTDACVSVSNSSAWRLCYTTNLVVFVFHNRRRVLGSRGRGGISRPSRNRFLMDEAEVISLILWVFYNLCVIRLVSYSPLLFLTSSVYFSVLRKMTMSTAHLVMMMILHSLMTKPVVMVLLKITTCIIYP